MASQRSKVSSHRRDRCSYLALLSVGWGSQVPHFPIHTVLPKAVVGKLWLGAICAPLRGVVWPIKLEYIILIAVISFFFFRCVKSHVNKELRFCGTSDIW